MINNIFSHHLCLIMRARELGGGECERCVISVNDFVYERNTVIHRLVLQHYRKHRATYHYSVRAQFLNVKVA